MSWIIPINYNKKPKSIRSNTGMILDIPKNTTCKMILLRLKLTSFVDTIENHSNHNYRSKSSTSTKRNF